MQNFKVQHQTPRKVKMLFRFLTYYPHIDNKNLMQTVKNKFKITRNEHLYIKMQILYCLWNCRIID